MEGRKTWQPQLFVFHYTSCLSTHLWLQTYTIVKGLCSCVQLINLIGSAAKRKPCAFLYVVDGDRPLQCLHALAILQHGQRLKGLTLCRTYRNNASLQLIRVLALYPDPYVLQVGLGMRPICAQHTAGHNGTSTRTKELFG